MVELDALGESNSRLLSIGRNLNQIARCLNAGEGAKQIPSVEQMCALSEFIRDHAAQASEVMRANIERWALK